MSDTASDSPVEEAERRAEQDDAEDPTTSSSTPVLVRLGNRGLEIAETIVYVGIAVLLLATAMIMVARSALDLTALLSGDLTEAKADALKLLDTLLLVFIVVELLYAVRITVARRELVAEPFLLVGVIASIKEIVVLSVKAADLIGKPEFTDAATEIGVLGGLVLVLAVATWLLRLKEREPDE